MAMRVYATPTDFDTFEGGFEGDDPALEKQLRAASIEVEGLTRLAVYSTDDDGYPTDQDIADAFAEATCAIVAHWGITEDPTGAEATLGAIKIGSVSLGTTSERAATKTDRTAQRIGEKAQTILRNAGLVRAVRY